MTYRIFLFSAALLGISLFCCGCSDEPAPDPPSARAELTVRLYETLGEKRYSEALAITDKLLALDPDDADLMEMRDRIIGNIAALKVQECINAKKLDTALKFIRNERKRYPVMPRLRLMEEEVMNLIALRNAAARLAAAATVPELTAALELIVPMAAKFPAAEQLHKDIALRQAELKQMRLKAAQAVEKAAGSAGKSVPAAKPVKP